MRYILAFIVLIFLSSCNNNLGYYNTMESYNNYDEAYDLVYNLKHDGVLIIVIPTENKKLEVFNGRYLEEDDPIKKEEYKQAYLDESRRVRIMQQTFINVSNSIYDFSDYEFVPDTLVKNLATGTRENIFLNNDLSFKDNLKIEDHKNIMILRPYRDYDCLVINKLDGTIPPNPFPYKSTLKTIELGLEFQDGQSIARGVETIDHAIRHINSKLTFFYKKSNS